MFNNIIVVSGLYISVDIGVVVRVAVVMTYIRIQHYDMTIYTTVSICMIGGIIIPIFLSRMEIQR